MSYKHYFGGGHVSHDGKAVHIDNIVFKNFEEMAPHICSLETDWVLKGVGVNTIIVLDDFVRQGHLRCTSRIPDHDNPSQSVAYYQITDDGIRTRDWFLL